MHMPPRAGSRCQRRGQHDVDSDYTRSESTFPQSRKILAEILERVPDDEQANDCRWQHRLHVQF
jgi:hypothetical protein